MTIHTHHFVPCPTGRRNSQGEPVRELVCECGARPREVYPSNPSRIGHRGMR